MIMFLILLSMFCITPNISAQEMTEGFDNPSLDNAWSLTADSSIKYSLTEKKGFLSITIPGDRPYDIWSNDVNDGFLLLRHDQGNGDWVIETLMEIHSSGHPYHAGLVVWSNPYVMYFWGVKRQQGKNRLCYSAEHIGISDLFPKDLDIDDDWVTLRIEKFGKKLLLQYWDENEESFVTYQTTNFKFPINGVGIVVRTFGESGTDLDLSVDYMKLIK